MDADGRCSSVSLPPVAAASSCGPDVVEAALAKALEAATGGTSRSLRGSSRLIDTLVGARDNWALIATHGKSMRK